MAPKSDNVWLSEWSEQHVNLQTHLANTKKNLIKCVVLIKHYCGCMRSKVIVIWLIKFYTITIVTSHFEQNISDSNKAITNLFVKYCDNFFFSSKYVMTLAFFLTGCFAFETRSDSRRFWRGSENYPSLGPWSLQSFLWQTDQWKWSWNVLPDGKGKGTSSRNRLIISAVVSFNW